MLVINSTEIMQLEFMESLTLHSAKLTWEKKVNKQVI